MTKMLKKLISAELIHLAGKRAEAIMEATPGIREAWLDQVRTSAASKAAGGTLLFVTDQDWVPAFFVWYHGAGQALPRED